MKPKHANTNAKWKRLGGDPRLDIKHEQELFGGWRTNAAKMTEKDPVDHADLMS